MSLLIFSANSALIVQFSGGRSVDQCFLVIGLSFGTSQPVSVRVALQSKSQSQDSNQNKVRELSSIIILMLGNRFCVLTMKQYSPKSPTDALDSSELDPCIAAENRLKKNVLSTK
ncbi:hypothetical protein WR25_06540 [Diploscapter pachys]|uniref:Uncharacterized protein n=1 Tax=Diploscapter pachys TaxID=2018661 RepID=A0A2A2LVW8_9BILA|nr:hypothetical protein WR25_06540 [Diploscapter pachys]